MTPKEKAIELVDKFTQTNGNAFFAKECALIAVDEIKKMLLSLYKPEYTSFITVNELMYRFEESDESEVMDGYEMVMYYDEVKQEIEKL
ncbi:MAG: hypothetical protein ACRCR2_05705 [Fusobacteriaceae bacterium]